jgi:hypothetical protein
MVYALPQDFGLQANKSRKRTRSGMASAENIANLLPENLHEITWRTLFSATI